MQPIHGSAVQLREAGFTWNEGALLLTARHCASLNMFTGAQSTPGKQPPSTLGVIRLRTTLGCMLQYEVLKPSLVPVSA